MEGDILMKIQESAENYLETILMLGKAKGNVRYQGRQNLIFRSNETMQFLKWGISFPLWGMRHPPNFMKCSSYLRILLLF